MAGKNHIERSFRILFDDSAGTPRDLSQDLLPGSVQGGGMTFDEVDMSGVSDTVKTFLKGQGTSEITARFHMNDTATTGATTVLNGHTAGAGTGTLTLRWGQSGVAPTTGDPEWEGEYVMLGCEIALDGNKFVHQVTFKPAPNATMPAWGTV